MVTILAGKGACGVRLTCLHAVQTVGQLFSMPQSRKRKKYLESLEAGMDLTGNPGPQVSNSPTISFAPPSRRYRKELVWRTTVLHLPVMQSSPFRLQKEAASAKKRRKRPFPPQHYVASVETLKTSDYSIPEMSATGDIICPEGYAATRPGELLKCWTPSNLLKGRLFTMLHRGNALS